MAIDIGAAATDRSASIAARTYVAKENPANATGTIDTVEIWADINLSNCEVATFFVVSGNNLSTRDSEIIGTVTSGSKQTFSGLSMDVETGDYIGTFYTSGGWIEVNTSGGTGMWYGGSGVDYIPCTNQVFTSAGGYTLSLYGTGTEAAAGWAGGDVNGVAIADIAKINGIALADITKVNGIS